jgi:hypothetical protein
MGWGYTFNLRREHLAMTFVVMTAMACILGLLLAFMPAPG